MIMISIWLCSCAQQNPNTSSQLTNTTEKVDSTKIELARSTLVDYLPKYTFSDTTYEVSARKGISILNSYPKGGSYTNPIGERFGYGIFWTRLMNETNASFEVSINFPADTFDIFSPIVSHLQLFLPPGTMTADKGHEFDYGATELKAFLDKGINEPTQLQKIIEPGQEHYFYVGLLYKAPNNGPVRTKFVLKEEDLFYSISIDPYGSALIPCGKLTF